MKYLNKITFFLILLIFSSCEEVVDIDLDTAPPRLVVDASIDWQKGTTGNEQKIKLTTTTSYYSTQIPTVSGASVSVKNSNNIIFDFIETPNTGEYLCATFIPEIGETYTLTIIYNGQTLSATETLKSVAPINRVEQEITPGFGGAEDLIRVKSFFIDPANTNDFYLFRTRTSITAIPEYNTADDTFFQGNEIFALYISEDLKRGDLVETKIYSISERYYNYMTILTSIAGSSGGSPFSSPPSTIRGNIKNTTYPDNFVLGYFSVSETDLITYTIQ